jgi:sulfite exporter TauE/SafE
MDLALVFLTGLFGSMHCVGMCGAIVAAYSTQDGFHNPSTGGKWGALIKHLSYNFGRILSYTIVGAMLGAVGGSFAGVKMVGEWFSALAGMVLIASGFWMLRIFPWMGFTEKISLVEEKQSFLLSLYTRSYGALLGSPTIESKFYIGFLTPLLPCGLLYSAFMMAVSSGSAVNGALTMALFGTGIVPSLVIVGYVSTFFRFRLRSWGDQLAALTIILMGVMMLLRGLGMQLPWMMIGAGGGHHH